MRSYLRKIERKMFWRGVLASHLSWYCAFSFINWDFGWFSDVGDLESMARVGILFSYVAFCWLVGALLGSYWVEKEIRND